MRYKSNGNETETFWASKSAWRIARNLRCKRAAYK